MTLPALAPLDTPRPLLRLVPDDAVSSGLPEALALACMAGIEPMPWQIDALDVLLAERADGTHACPEAGIEVPRQNGKSLGVIVVRILWGLFVAKEERVVYTAHTFQTAIEVFHYVRRAIEDTPELARQVAPRGIKTTNGKETITLTDNREFRIFARTAGGGRGFAGSTVIIDEALMADQASMSALVPVLTAKRNSQLIYASSTPPASIPADVLRAVRDRAERGEPELGYIAYGVDADPAEIDAEDPALWAVANPAYGITIFDDTLRRARRATTRAGFISEHLGVWPDTGRTSPISHEAWRGLVDVDDPLDVDRPIDVAFDVAADGGTASVVAAGTSQSGRRALRLLHYDDAPELWLIERLDELIREGRRVCYDARAFGRDYVDELIRRGAKVADKATPHGLLVPANLDAHVTACLSLQADVKAGRLVHDGHHALETAVVYARTRKAGDGWVWDRHHGSHAPPIVAATLALWSVERRPSPRPRFAIL